MLKDTLISTYRHHSTNLIPQCRRRRNFIVFEMRGDLFPLKYPQRYERKQEKVLENGRIWNFWNFCVLNNDGRD